MNEEPEIIDVVIETDKPIENTWMWDILQMDNIPITKTYVEEDGFYELEIKPKDMDGHYYKYIIHYDFNNNHHLFNRYLLHKLSEIVLKLENKLEENIENEPEE